MAVNVLAVDRLFSCFGFRKWDEFVQINLRL
jgi:hypothetical protein